ncbi:MAG TPA: BTAD domain-containing putative transcriptional regulator [Solirubrobacteraceae bacterium]|nr:BTAD domain-containing putative transcriptional regulator [Solirubrobacteraceae bacterium]
MPTAAWTHGRARDLVKLLALAPGHRLPRERAVEELWPQLDAEAGLANLHKAAHHARRAIGRPEAVVLREGQVMLAPEARVETDVERFEARGDPDLYAGELLPDDRYAAWAQRARARLRDRYLEGLRAAGRWEELADAEPGDEAAQRAVMRARLAAGDRRGALRAFERLHAALEPLGLRPSIETLALHGRIAGGAALDRALAAVELALTRAPVTERAQLLATRADLLMAVGDRGAAAAYADAAAAAGPEGMALRIRQAWAQLAAGDPAAAQATLAPLAPRSHAERAGHLLAQAAAAWFSGDVDGARRAAAEAQPLSVAGGLAREARTAVQIQAMVAHSTGEWPTALRLDLDASLRAPDLADTLFDGHLCVAQYVLTSGVEPDRIRAVAEDLHAGALRSGARRAQVFAATVLGEIALVAARLGEAHARLDEAVRLSREISAVSAEALATMRLGEAMRARGEMAEGQALLADALVISRWSPLSGHLQPLAYAALLHATEDDDVGRQRLDDAEAQLRGEDLLCAYCGMAFRVAAAIAAARAGQSDRAARFLSAAQLTAALWRGGPWTAALDESRGELAWMRGERAAARALLRASTDGFVRERRRLDAERVETRLAEIGG